MKAVEKVDDWALQKAAPMVGQTAVCWVDCLADLLAVMTVVSSAGR